MYELAYINIYKFTYIQLIYMKCIELIQCKIEIFYCNYILSSIYVYLWLWSRWLLSLIFCPNMIFFFIIEYFMLTWRSYKMCREDRNIGTVYIFCRHVCFFLPLGLYSYIYIYIYMGVRSGRRRLIRGFINCTVRQLLLRWSGQGIWMRRSV
jgi:hypothetical protein